MVRMTTEPTTIISDILQSCPRPTHDVTHGAVISWLNRLGEVADGVISGMEAEAQGMLSIYVNYGTEIDDVALQYLMDDIDTVRGFKASLPTVLRSNLPL